MSSQISQISCLREMLGDKSVQVHWEQIVLKRSKKHRTPRGGQVRQHTVCTEGTQRCMRGHTPSVHPESSGLTPAPHRC